MRPADLLYMMCGVAIYVGLLKRSMARSSMNEEPLSVLARNALHDRIICLTVFDGVSLQVLAHASTSARWTTDLRPCVVYCTSPAHQLLQDISNEVLPAVISFTSDFGSF